jgi:twitching motility protein PilT
LEQLKDNTMSLDSYLEEAAKAGASDFHLVSNLPPTIRVNGQLTELTKEPIEAADILSVVKKSIGDEKFDEFVKSKELDFAYGIPDGTRFRINLHWEKGNVSVAARTIPANIPTMEEIEMPEIAYDLCNYDRGLILLTGPTGSGKSTSLAAMINYINQNRKTNIITLEDPIEFVFKPIKSIIRQRQLGTDMTSFENGLVHVLRQDPNVIMVGEMRNLETIAATITLAETGHLVFATLHTYSAAQTIDRIIDIFPPHQQNQVRMQVSITLKGVISQRLMPQASGGQVAAREVMLNNPAVANLIRENKVAQINTAIQTGAKEGMITMDNALMKLYKEKIITKEVLDANSITSRSRFKLT